MPSVLIVVLNWNGLEDTVKCVSSLLNLSYQNFHILIVDNGSKAKPSSSNFSNDKRISIEFNKKNVGFAEGVNIGIRHAIDSNFDFVALINNDATVDQDWLSKLVDASEKSNASICAGLLLDHENGTIDSAGEMYSSWGVSFPNARDLPRNQAPESASTFGATGGAVLYKTSLFKDIGLFDAKFFAYYEDADVNFRSQLAGYTSYYTKEAVAYHNRGATSKKIPGFTVYQMFKNLPLLFWKNIPSKLVLKIGVRFLVLYTAMFGKAVVSRSGIPAIKGVLVSIYLFWSSAIWQRFNIQRHKKVSASYIWSVIYKDLPPNQSGMRKIRDILVRK